MFLPSSFVRTLFVIFDALVLVGRKIQSYYFCQNIAYLFNLKYYRPLLIICSIFLPQFPLGSLFKPSGQVQKGFPMFFLSKYTWHWALVPLQVIVSHGSNYSWINNVDISECKDPYLYYILTLHNWKTLWKPRTDGKFFIEAPISLDIAWASCIFQTFIGFVIRTIFLEHTNTFVVILAKHFSLFHGFNRIFSKGAIHFKYSFKIVG